MPANTPVFSTFEPLNRAIMADWRGFGNPGNTPRISTPNSCVSDPEKTVRATPFIPGRKSSRANKRGSFALAFRPGVCAGATPLREKMKAATSKTGRDFFIKLPRRVLKCRPGTVESVFVGNYSLGRIGTRKGL